MINYIVRNCPSIEDIVNYEINKDGDFIQTGIDTPDYCVKNKKQCKDITDCLLKRIVELCDSNASKVLYEGETSKIKFVEENPLAKKILELLEIEEVDE